MLSLQSLLGKRSPSTHPTGLPLPSGDMPGGEDVPAAPASKLQEVAQPDLETRLELLLASLSELKVQVAVVPELQSQITKLNQQVVEEKEEKKRLSTELESLRQALSRSDQRLIKAEGKISAAEKGKQPVSYAQSLGKDAGAALQKQQEENRGELAELKQQMERQERQVRAQNVMLFNVEEGSQSPMQQVQACLQAAGVPDTGKIVQAVRLGRGPRGSAGESSSRPRPVKLVMQSAADAAGLLRHTRKLRESQRVNLDRDITPAQAQLRRSKQGAAKELRERGYATVWRGEQRGYINRATNAREVFKGTVPPPPPPV